MDEMKGGDAFSSSPKSNNDNIEEEVEEDKMEEVNSYKIDPVGIELVSFETEKVINEQFMLILDDEEKEELITFNEGEKEKEKMNVDEIDVVEVETSFEPITMNVEESILMLDSKEKEELAKESDVIAHEEMKEHPMKESNDKDNVSEEDAEEEVKNEEQVEVVSKKKINELRRGEKGSKKKIVLKAMNEVIAKDRNEEDAKEEVKHKEVDIISSKKIVKTRKKGLKRKIVLKDMNEVIDKERNEREPSNKKNIQTMEELNNKQNFNDQGQEKDAKEEAKNGEQVKDIPRKKIGRLRKRVRKDSEKKLASKHMDGVVIKDRIDHEPSNKSATKEKDANFMGMIFMCSSKTKKDCYHYKVLGLPASKRDIVLKISEGMKLFLFDVDLKLLYGIYKAAGPGGYNIEPRAFKSAFPSQVRFTVYDDCLPLAEGKFKNVIKDNYYQKKKFDCQLTAEQVKNLCKLFQTASIKSKGLCRNPETLIHKFSDQDRSKKLRHRTETHTIAGQDKTGKRKHKAETSMFKDQDRRGPLRHRAGTHTFVDQDRSRRHLYRAEAHTFADQDRRRHRHHDAYEREIYMSPIAPLPSHPSLPSPSALVPPPRSYAYEGSLLINGYPRDPPVEHQDGRFRDLELRRPDHVEVRDSFHKRDDGQFLDSELRHRGLTEHRDPYVLYRDRPLYLDLSYSAAQLSQYLPDTRISLHPAASLQNRGLYDRYTGARSWY